MSAIHCERRPSSLRVKQFDDSGRSLGKSSDRVQHWPPIGERSFVESYLKADINVCVRTRGEAKQWCAIFQYAGVEDLRLRAGAPSENRHGSMASRQSNEPLMLAHNVKPVKGVETVIPSLAKVWLWAPRREA